MVSEALADHVFLMGEASVVRSPGMSGAARFSTIFEAQSSRVIMRSCIAPFGRRGIPLGDDFPAVMRDLRPIS
jgi:hypothetical protein